MEREAQAQTAHFVQTVPCETAGWPKACKACSPREHLGESEPGRAARQRGEQCASSWQVPAVSSRRHLARSAWCVSCLDGCAAVPEGDETWKGTTPEGARQKEKPLNSKFQGLEFPREGSEPNGIRVVWKPQCSQLLTDSSKENPGQVLPSLSLNLASVSRIILHALRRRQPAGEHRLLPGTWRWGGCLV